MPIKDHGKFIVFDGPHTSGKTTQAKLLYRYFRSIGIEAKVTKEPYSKGLAPLICKYSNGELINSPVLMYLLAADRYVHLADICSWMKKGIYVVCDRYILSSWVYQQIQGISLDEIRRINYFAINPHLTFYIDLPLKNRMERMEKTHKDRQDFFLRAENLIREQELYESLTSSWDERRYGKMIVLNGQQSIMKIHEDIVDFTFNELR